MLFFVQKLLEISMRLDNSSWAVMRFGGKILGIFPVWYSERLEKKLFHNDRAVRALKRRCRRKKRKRFHK